MMDSGQPAHERYRVQLELARSDTSIVDAMDADPGRREWWPLGSAVRRTFGRFYADAAPYLSIVLETLDDPQVVVSVEAFEERPHDTDQWVVRLDPLGWLRIALATADPKLPTLGALVNLEGSRVVRYRPGQRCVVRVDEGGVTRWAKTFADDHGAAIHRTDRMLWEHRHELTFQVAPPGRYDPANRTIWNDNVSGVPVMPELMSANGPTLAERMGRACASLATSTLTPVDVLRAEDELERTTVRAKTLAATVPSLAPQVEEFLRLLAPALAAAVGRSPRPLHGAPHPEQWLLSGSGLGLVDFDRAGLGDPELEVATFQAEIDFKGGIVAGPDMVNQAFLDGYEDVAGPLDRKLLAGYRAAKRMHKALRTAQAIRPEGAERATVHLQRAFDALI